MLCPCRKFVGVWGPCSGTGREHIASPQQRLLGFESVMRPPDSLLGKEKADAMRQLAPVFDIRAPGGFLPANPDIDPEGTREDVSQFRRSCDLTRFCLYR